MIAESEKAALPQEARVMEQFKDLLRHAIVNDGVTREVIEEMAADFVEEGMAQGIQRGEKQAQHAFAERSLAKGIDVATIAESTGLSQRDIQQISCR